MANRSLSFKGDHKEIGKQIGEQYKAWGKKEVRVPPYADSYFQKQLEIYEKFFPQYIEYLEGLSLGLSLPKDKIILSYLTGFLHGANIKPANKCSTFVLKNINGVLVGRNYDWMQSSELISSIVTLEFTDKFTNNLTGITDMATLQPGKSVVSSQYIIMLDDAWNDKGLFICLNGAPGTNQDFGMWTPHVIQCIAERCSTTDEAVDLIKQIPINNPKIFTIADKNGNFAVVERSLNKPIQVRRANDVIFTTNHYNHPELILENLTIFPEIPFHSTFARYYYLQYNLLKNKENLNIDEIVSLLEKPPVTQNWRGISNGDVMTIWTYGLNLSTGKYNIEFAPILKERTILKN